MSIGDLKASCKMFLQLVIGACWWETTHEHSCALHFWIFVVSVQTRSFYGKNFFFFFHSAAGGLLGGRCGLSTGNKGTLASCYREIALPSFFSIATSDTPLRVSF